MVTNEHIAKLSGLTNITHMNEVLDNICVVRIVGTPEHARVRKVWSKEKKTLNFSDKKSSALLSGRSNNFDKFYETLFLE